MCAGQSFHAATRRCSCYTLRAFMLCCALYALYTIGLYLLFRDRLFYSLFIARSLML